VANGGGTGGDGRREREGFFARKPLPPFVWAARGPMQKSQPGPSTFWPVLFQSGSLIGRQGLICKKYEPNAL
jgi:hypothetical protein